jgi:small subunit ribosomal protein S8
MHSDPIADLLTRIRNGQRVKMPQISCPHSRIKEEIVKILVQEGWVQSYQVMNSGKFPQLEVKLKYDHRRMPVIRDLKRVSKPGLRVYRDTTELAPKRSGLTTVVLTTSQGVLSDREARKRGVGGEVICEVQ